jgi:AraC-like DNA-binding protein
MLLCGCFEIVLLAITAYPTASVYSFQASRPPTGMLVDSQFCNKLQCRDSGFVQSPESQYYRDPVLGDALRRIARYSKVTNEALVFGYREGNRLIINLSYSGVPRHSDRHQIEFCMFAALRICRVLTGQNLVPQHFSISHHRSEGTSEMARFVGTKVAFGADTDEFALNIDARELPLIHSDPYLNDLLLKYCEAALAYRRGDLSELRTKVENAISSLLPHGKVLVEDVARSLGMSERTLARKLSDEGLNFTDILQQLRRDLAVRYLDDRKLHVSKIAWLLGFHEVSAFTHAFKRWTGKTPSQMRTAGAY